MDGVEIRSFPFKWVVIVDCGKKASCLSLFYKSSAFSTRNLIISTLCSFFGSRSLKTSSMQCHPSSFGIKGAGVWLHGLVRGCLEWLPPYREPTQHHEVAAPTHTKFYSQIWVLKRFCSTIIADYLGASRLAPLDA